MTYLKAVLIAADQLVNALLAGWPDETMSSRAWRWEQSGVRAWPRRVIDLLFFRDPHPGRNPLQSERTGRQLPPELRTG